MRIPSAVPGCFPCRIDQAKRIKNLPYREKWNMATSAYNEVDHMRKYYGVIVDMLTRTTKTIEGNHALNQVEFFSLIHSNVFNFRLDDIKQITFDDPGKDL
jgi:hypothetical protein